MLNKIFNWWKSLSEKQKGLCILFLLLALPIIFVAGLFLFILIPFIVMLVAFILLVLALFKRDKRRQFGISSLIAFIISVSTFSMVDMFGLDVDYVAQVLGLSKGATKGLLYRARMNLDSFFSKHCSLLEENNPCSCKAWIDFSSKRENMQQNARKLTNHINYKETGYEYNEKVRAKIFYLYTNMPEQKPPREWYESLLKIISEKNS